MQFKQKQTGSWFKRFAFFPTIVATKDGKKLWVWLESFEQKNAEDHDPFGYRTHFERRSLSLRHIGSQPYRENTAKYA